MKNKQEMPKWFTGTIYDEGDIVTNKFSGETFELNALELSIYDFIMGCAIVFESMHYNKIQPSDDIINDYHKGINWFKKFNPKAYYALLD